jgi:phosphoribosylanthranilate isomerase
MEAIARPRVKICCILSVAEADLAVAAGAHAVGLVSAMPSGPGVIDDDLIARIARRVPPGVTAFLLTSGRDAAAIVEQTRAAGVGAVQLVDTLRVGRHEDIRAALPGVKLVQVVHVNGPGAVGEALAAAPHVDALLLDSGRPQAAVKELGGTGRPHDWSISRRIRDLAPVPVYLAGGLDAGNARRAIEEVGPFGIDVCSGVRTDGRLDPTKLTAFMDAVGVRSRVDGRRAAP